MIHARILIKEKADATPALPEVKEFTTGQLKDIVILEEGMQSGKTSISFHIIDSKGKSIIVETSAAIFETTMGAIKGAELRWAERPHMCTRCSKVEVPGVGMVCDSCLKGTNH